MKSRLHVNNMLRSIGDQEVEDNFRQLIMPQFKTYFPGAIEIVIEDNLEVYVNDLPLLEAIIDFVIDCHNIGESILGIDWVGKYAHEENYVRQVIPFKTNGKRIYVCPEVR